MKPSTSKMSKGKAMKKDIPGQQPADAHRAARSHRSETTEAERQRKGVPKTHPTRAAVSARKGPGKRPGRDA